MKGIILAGGTGSRLYPLTRVVNKHLLPVGKHRMIEHALYKLREAGITELLVVTGRRDLGDIVRLLGSGATYGVSLTYKVQEQAQGIADALFLAAGFAAGELVTVVLGDNIFEDDLAPYIRSYERQGSGAKILLKRVEDPTRFGVPELREGRIVAIQEKPARPSSTYAVTGIYMYDQQVFEFIKDLRPSERNELEITDVNNAYIAHGELSYEILSGWWTDAGTLESLLKANQLALQTAFTYNEDAR